VPRPPVEDDVRRAVRDYLAAAVDKSAEEAPLNVLAVAKQTGFDRKTLKKYSLDIEVGAAAKQQAQAGKLSLRETARRSQADSLRDRDHEIAALRARCEGLVARICLAEGNAQRLGIDAVELWKSLATPDRSISHAGRPGRKPAR
jgi:DnaJ-domain-containing protein 1